MAGYDELLALVQQRRSIRRFRRDPVPDEVIHKLIEVARYAPSAGNAQPWEFIVVREQKTKDRIAEIYLEQLQEKAKVEELRPPEYRFWGKDSPSLSVGFRDAAALIVVIGDPRLVDAYPLRTKLDKGPQHIISSLANVVVTLHYAAASLGLASQYLSDSGSPFMEAMLKDLLGIPDPYRTYEIVCLGYADMAPSARYVRSPEEFVHWERFDPIRRRSDADVREYIQSRLRPQFKKVL
ncbi:MAG: nitroreductase family protein [Deltaproteobacteria bacterium]|nr:nitroreductase family protein [Deltaproteobacteria bacterium]